MENNRFRLNFLIPLLCWTVLFQFLIEAFETELNGGIWVSWKLETEKTKEQICNQDCLKLDGKYIKGISAFWRFFGGGESHAGHQNCASCRIKQPGLWTPDSPQLPLEALILSLAGASLPRPRARVQDGILGTGLLSASTRTLPILAPTEIISNILILSLFHIFIICI